MSSSMTGSGSKLRQRRTTFLSPTDYHRWHAPVNGIITKTLILPGTYCAALPDDGAPVDDPDLEGDPHGALIRSQPWLTVFATRALIFVKADNPPIGLMCFIGLRMAEVSTCAISVEPGQRVAMGDEIGMYHFGGSSHALVFGPQAKITFEDLNGQPIESHTRGVENTHA